MGARLSKYGRLGGGGERLGVLRILGPSGDTRVTWNPADVDEVDDMRRRFDEIIREGYLVFELEPESKEGRQVRSFDPEARELRAFRPLAGG
jgi:hypothetical protein